MGEGQAPDDMSRPRPPVGFELQKGDPTEQGEEKEEEVTLAWRLPSWQRIHPVFWLSDQLLPRVGFPSVLHSIWKGPWS